MQFYPMCMHIYGILVRTLGQIAALAIVIAFHFCISARGKLWFDFHSSSSLGLHTILHFLSLAQRAKWLPVHIWIFSSFFLLLISFYCALYYLFAFRFLFRYCHCWCYGFGVAFFPASDWICMILCIFQEPLFAPLMVNKLMLSTTQISSVAIFCIFHFVHKMCRIQKKNFTSFLFCFAVEFNRITRQNVWINFNCIRNGIHARLDKDATAIHFFLS